MNRSVQFSPAARAYGRACCSVIGTEGMALESLVYWDGPL